ncbi:hypothetical protein [Chryseobacterium salviniae]|uniref:Uncharacterized protein n=1 Tax=Chryseobacterium salviniae TaxID=3101750 RepID=A0ABU6HR53_9FLAO|nr:hypothetical protein [Chryseobacterium sp. T9W2-O]MEC3875535.1 hypothetical protein [Chryseobacterium sp. T9W2-O]
MMPLPSHGWEVLIDPLLPPGSVVPPPVPPPWGLVTQGGTPYPVPSPPTISYTRVTVITNTDCVSARQGPPFSSDASP